jgi:hypothetical protein
MMFYLVATHGIHHLGPHSRVVCDLDALVLGVDFNVGIEFTDTIDPRLLT